MVEEEGVQIWVWITGKLSSCLRLNDLVWLQGHWHWREAIFRSILASNGRNTPRVVYNFLMRRREIFDLELGPGRNSREFRAPALPVKLVFNIQCHDTCVPRRQWSALYEKEQRAVAPTLIFCYLWEHHVEKKICGLIGTLFCATGCLHSLLLEDLWEAWECFFSILTSPKN